MALRNDRPLEGKRKHCFHLTMSAALSLGFISDVIVKYYTSKAIKSKASLPLSTPNFALLSLITRLSFAAIRSIDLRRPLTSSPVHSNLNPNRNERINESVDGDECYHSQLRKLAIASLGLDCEGGHSSQCQHTLAAQQSTH